MTQNPPPPKPHDPFDLLMQQLIREERFIFSHELIAKAILKHLITLDLDRFKRSFTLNDAAIPSPN